MGLWKLYSSLWLYQLCIWQKYSILNFSRLHGYLEQYVLWSSYVLDHGSCYNNGYYQSWRICSELWVWKISFVHHSPILFLLGVQLEPPETNCTHFSHLELSLGNLWNFLFMSLCLLAGSSLALHHATLQYRGIFYFDESVALS